MSRRISGRPRPRIVALVLVIAAGCARPDEAVLDAWALWLEHEPTCAEAFDATRAAALSPRWRRALVALALETLEVMEERLAETGGGGEPKRLLSELVAGSRRLCEPSQGGPVTALASTVAHARAEVASTRSRLEVVLPLDDGEVRRRARPYDGRLSNAVSDALERLVEGSDQGGEGEEEETAEVASGAAPRSREPGPAPGETAVSGAADRGEAPSVADGGHGQTTPEGERIFIHPTSGEPWAVIRQRRTQAAQLRLARWRELYDEGLRPVAELRAELARELRRESLDGLIGLCVRLGQAAERAPRTVVDGAPSKRLAADLAAVLEAYAGAGRACAFVRPVLAWERLATGDRHWEAARVAAESLAARPGLPESLHREPARWNVPEKGGVD